MTGGALAIREDQEFWSDNQALVLRQAGIDDQVTRAELTSFLHLCQRTGLDPFSRQVYLIGRYDKREGRKVYNPQTGIDGYRIVAQRTAERTGQPLSYDDTLWCGPDGQWTDVWLSQEPPVAAKVTVHRGLSRFSAVALWSEYVPLNRDGAPTGLWAKMPAVMVAKCAESLALRKAFPHDLAGVYTSEEMAQANNQALARSVAPPGSSWVPEVDDRPNGNGDGPGPDEGPVTLHPAPRPEQAGVMADRVSESIARAADDAGIAYNPATGEVADEPVTLQDLAAQAWTADTVEALREVYDRAKQARVLTAKVHHPADPKRSPALSGLITERKVQLLAAERPVAADGMPQDEYVPEVDEHGVLL